jgi:hypothetical protein
MNKFKNIGRFNRQAKLIIGGAGAIGSVAGISCAYIYYMIESIVVSK